MDNTTSQLLNSDFFHPTLAVTFIWWPTSSDRDTHITSGESSKVVLVANEQPVISGFLASLEIT